MKIATAMKNITFAMVAVAAETPESRESGDK